VLDLNNVWVAQQAQQLDLPQDARRVCGAISNKCLKKCVARPGQEGKLVKPVLQCVARPGSNQVSKKCVARAAGQAGERHEQAGGSRMQADASCQVAGLQQRRLHGGGGGGSTHQTHGQRHL
jgi:hypothetical protein